MQGFMYMPNSILMLPEPQIYQNYMLLMSFNFISSYYFIFISVWGLVLGSFCVYVLVRMPVQEGVW